MGDIFDTNSQFEFDKISLITPTTISGGVHFSKILINKKQLYIQSPKCKTKQGIVKSGKKSHADLVFTNDDEEFILWIETLEQTVRKHIFTNRARWFDMDLDEDDIESYFSPTIKLFKSGKQYIMRVNISQRIGATPLKIYDENEEDVDIETIDENTSLISILEVQGVRCSTKSFQIDVELKQIMVIKPVNLFEKCIIKKTKTVPEKDLVKVEKKEEEKKVAEVPQIEPKVEEEISTEKTSTEETSTEKTSTEETSTEKTSTEETSTEETSTEETSTEKTSTEKTSNEKTSGQDDPTEEDVKDTATDHLIHEEDDVVDNDEGTQNDDILEIDLDIDEIKDDDTFHLKEKTEVYYQMYREARQKAKLAKSLALSSYLEARRIKNLYMLDDIDDSDESDLEEK